MERPKEDDYKTIAHYRDIDGFPVSRNDYDNNGHVSDLNKYIDQLEAENKELKEKLERESYTWEQMEDAFHKGHWRNPDGGELNKSEFIKLKH